jgi:hypothetical protein
MNAGGYRLEVENIKQAEIEPVFEAEEAEEKEELKEEAKK